MAAEAESRVFGGTPRKEQEDDTFLTGLLNGKRRESDLSKVT